MYAIIKTGGKQYRVQKDDVFKIEKINAEAGDTVTFDEVIAVGGDTLTVGTPFVEGTAVHAEVVEQGKNEELLAIANEKGIEVSSKATKAEILEAIEA